MNQNSLELMLKSLNDFIINSANNDDTLKAKKLYNDLLSINKTGLTLNDLDQIKKEIIYLETTYDYFNELSNYFDPIYSYLKNEIHKIEVNKIREKNRKKNNKHLDV
jgi:hypothetical protein